MKFGLLLQSHIVKEWQNYYINYENLKDFIDEATDYYKGIVGTVLDANHLPLEEGFHSDDDDDKSEVDDTLHCCNRLLRCIADIFKPIKHDTDVVEHYETLKNVRYTTQTSIHACVDDRRLERGSLCDITPRSSDSSNENAPLIKSACRPSQCVVELKVPEFDIDTPKRSYSSLPPVTPRGIFASPREGRVLVVTNRSRPQRLERPDSVPPQINKKEKSDSTISTEEGSDKGELINTSDTTGHGVEPSQVKSGAPPPPSKSRDEALHSPVSPLLSPPAKEDTSSPTATPTHTPEPTSPLTLNLEESPPNEAEQTKEAKDARENNRNESNDRERRPRKSSPVHFHLSTDTSKAEILREWRNAIIWECEKVNKFYYVVERELANEFQTLKHKLFVARRKKDLFTKQRSSVNVRTKIIDQMLSSPRAERKKGRRTPTITPKYEPPPIPNGSVTLDHSLSYNFPPAESHSPIYSSTHKDNRKKPKSVKGVPSINLAASVLSSPQSPQSLSRHEEYDFTGGVRNKEYDLMRTEHIRKNVLGGHITEYKYVPAHLTTELFRNKRVDDGGRYEVESELNDALKHLPKINRRTSGSPKKAAPPSLEEQAMAAAWGHMNDDEKELQESIYRSMVMDPLQSHADDQVNKRRNIQMYQLKLNVYILYQRLVALSNFSSLNKIGFNKILKKFDKNLRVTTRKKWMREIIDESHFVTSDDCTVLMSSIVQLYAEVFERGNITGAKMKLIDSITWSGWSGPSYFRMGLKMGIIMGMIAWVISEWVDNTQQLEHHASYVYRCVGCFILWLWLWGLDMYIWSKYRINYVFIFEFDPRTRLTYYQIFDHAATLTIVYLLNAIVYIRFAQWWGKHFAIVLPAALFAFMFLQLFVSLFPFWNSRKFLLRALYETIIAPAGTVRFKDFYFGDVLTSMVKILADAYMALCLLVMDQFTTPRDHGSCHNSKWVAWPLIICLPYWFRFMQCLNRYFVTGDRIPHLPNACKYGLAMTVTLLGSVHSAFSHPGEGWGPLRIFWLAVTASSTAYVFFWDVRMDWALFPMRQCDDPDSDPILGRPLEYPVWWYYIAIVLDLGLRFTWTFTLVPIELNPYWVTAESEENTMLFLAAIEIAELFRRFMWGVFRVENAHMGRKDEFRSYDYVPLLYEHSNLVDVKEKENRPRSMIFEIVSMVVVVLILVIVIWITYALT